MCVWVCVGVCVCVCVCVTLINSPVGLGNRISRQHLCRGVRIPQKCILDMKLNNLMVRLQ